MRCISELLCHLMAIFCLYKMAPHGTIVCVMKTDSRHDASPPALKMSMSHKFCN